MADLTLILGRPLAGELVGVARVIAAGALVVAAEIALCREIAVKQRCAARWRGLLDPGIAALGEALGALQDGGPAAFWAEAEAIAASMTAESAVRRGGMEEGGTA